MLGKVTENAGLLVGLPFKPDIIQHLDSLFRHPNSCIWIPTCKSHASAERSKAPVVFIRNAKVAMFLLEGREVPEFVPQMTYSHFRVPFLDQLLPSLEELSTEIHYLPIAACPLR